MEEPAVVPESTAAVASTAGRKVLIGLTPMANPGWLTYLPVPGNIPYHPGSTAFVLILWETASISYEIQVGSYTDGHTKPFERQSNLIPASPEDSNDDRIKQWITAYPNHELLEVGATLRTMAEAAEFLRTWRKNSLKYHIFWDNNSTFVDAFCAVMINGAASWKINVFAPSGQKTASPAVGQVNATKPSRKGSTNSYSVALNEEGRVNVEFQENELRILIDEEKDASGVPKKAPHKEFIDTAGYKSVPAMSIVILIVGSRGDVQPFIALGKELKKYGHRVRLATHSIFRQFVTENGLEFYPLAGDPNELMAYMVKNTKSSRPITNLFSYELVEFMTWEGLGDIINNFRRHSLGLPRIPTTVAPSMLKNLETNFADIVGFFFLDLATSYTPPPDLVEFLNAGPPPVYIGFGSIVVDDPDALTQIIFDAVEKSGTRALVSKGWGGIGGDQLKIPSNIYLIGNCPHDWLFQHVSAVVHHGGAGTTAAGLKAGKPTIIVPFFGDQPFWGAMVASIGAGPPPINNKKLTAERLASAITFALLPETVEAAKNASNQIKAENGVVEGARSFHRHLPLNAMRCDVDPSRIAIWYVPHLNVKLSRHVADVAIEAGRILPDQLLPYRYIQWEPESARSSSYFLDSEEPDPIPSPSTASSTGLQPPQAPPSPSSAPSGIRKSVSQASMRLMHSLSDNVSQGAKLISDKITSLTATTAYATAHAGGKTVQKGVDTVVKGVETVQKSMDSVVSSLTASGKTVQRGVEKSTESAHKSLDSVSKGVEKGVEAYKKSVEIGVETVQKSVESVQKGVGATQRSMDNVMTTLSTSLTRGRKSVGGGPVSEPQARPRFGRRRKTVKTFDHPHTSLSPHPSHGVLSVPTANPDDPSMVASPIPSRADNPLSLSPREVVILEQVSSLNLHEDENHDEHDDGHHEYPLPGNPEATLKRFDTISSRYSMQLDD
ncbi:hypothetical protein HDU67_000302 [Dinochytrium kinnereticum]|nr:hypothetical protein HDU67_000302 [Dinochytrium kinnereticum]